jgi:hypothetical protein
MISISGFLGFKVSLAVGGADGFDHQGNIAGQLIRGFLLGLRNLSVGISDGKDVGFGLG